MTKGLPELSQATDASAARPRRWLRGVAVGLWCICLFCASLWLFTRNNAFTAEFHPDEPGKVIQILTDTRNHNHPQLLLELTQRWLDCRGLSLTKETVILAGRQVSAFFAAVTVTSLALAAYLSAGFWAILFASILLMLCPQLITLSHYMKEDTALVAGIALAVLASRIIWSTQTWWARVPAWVLLALGCAAATSGKYVGIMTLVMPLTLLFFAPGFRWFRPLLRLALFLPAFALFLGLINHRALNLDNQHSAASLLRVESSILRPESLRGMVREGEHAATHHQGITASRPNGYFARTSVEQAGLSAAIAILLLPIALILTRRTDWRWEALLLLFLIYCTTVISFSVILVTRYVLPMSVLFATLAAIALARLAFAIKSRPVARTTFLCLLTLALLAASVPAACDYTRQFVCDSRYALNNWARTNLPPGARILADNYAELQTYDFPFARERHDVQLRTGFSAANLRREFYNLAPQRDVYYAICDMTYFRYFETQAFPLESRRNDYNFSRRIYDRLLTAHKPVWSSVPSRNMSAFTNPEIHVYKLTAIEMRELQRYADGQK